MEAAAVAVGKGGGIAAAAAAAAAAHPWYLTVLVPRGTKRWTGENLLIFSLGAH